MIGRRPIFKENAMSFVGFFSTSLSGLNAQAQALGAISNNIANSQTVGYRRVDTRFEDLVTQASQSHYQPGGVVASPLYVNSAPGVVETTGTTTNLAITGNGFFVVSKPTDVSGSTVSFGAQDYFTRAGDFQIDDNGYLVNGSGYYAQGFTIDPTTGLTTGSIGQVQVAEQIMPPKASTTVTYRADLPADAAAGAQPPSTVEVFDSLGTAHSLDLTWTKGATAGAWTLDLAAPDGTATAGPFAVTFDGDGLLASVTPSPVSIDVTFPGATPQTIAVDLGAIGSASGTTQYSGTTIDLVNMASDGFPSGGFRDATIDSTGRVSINYDNGESSVAFQLALARFNAPQNLQTVEGSAFLATGNSGAALVGKPGESGLGKLTGSAVESSNVDIGKEFTDLITTQRAYSANAKVLTTVDEMLQEILAVKR